MSPAVDTAIHKIDELDEKFGSAGKHIAETAAAFFTAEAAIEAMKEAAHLAAETLKEIVIEGSAAINVEKTFERLTESAGLLGNTLLTKVREGLHGTVTDMDIMVRINQTLGAGLKLTEEQMGTLAKGAFALAKSYNIDVTTAMDRLSDAMVTGKTKSIALLTGKIDLAAAEDAYAAKMNTTTDKLTEQGKAAAIQEAILRKVKEATDRVGEGQVTLADKFKQAEVGIKNWEEELGTSIAMSPHVSKAFDDIRDSILHAFGGDMKETIVNWVNSAADAVSEYGPKIIHGFVEIKDWIVDIYHTVTETWDALPDWLKNVAENTILAVAGVYILDRGITGAGATIADFISEASNLTQIFTGMPEIMGHISGSFKLLGGLSTLDFTSLSTAGTSLKLLGGAAVTAIGPLGQIAIVAAAIMAAWEIGKLEKVSDFFEKIGLRIAGYSGAEADAMIATDHLTQAQVAQAKATTGQDDTAKKIADAIAEMGKAHEHAAINVKKHTDEQDRAALVMGQSKEEAKKYAAALAEIDSVGQGVEGTLATINGDVVEAVKYYLEAGVAAEKLATIYDLSTAQIKAVEESMKSMKKELELQNKALVDSEARWSDYWALQVEMSGSATAKTISNIEKWKAAQIKSHVDAKIDTQDFYDWLAATEIAMYDKEEKSRLESDVHSKSHFIKLKEDAEEAYDYALNHADQFTSGYISDLAKTKDAAADAARNWRDNMGTVLDQISDKVHTLSGEWITLDEAMKRHDAGGSSDVTSQNFDKSVQQFHLDGRRAYEMAKMGYSFEEIAKYLQNGGTGQIPPPAGPRIPGFEQGGVGDFGSGTLAMLHGHEAIVPLDRAGGVPLSSVIHNWYINGTGADVARQVSAIIMRDLKSGKHFGAA